MNIVIWITIILVAIFLIRLLKKWIRRLIFIAILLVIAFFIYGLFSPSWASKLWYNVRTFPDRIVSRFSDKNFIDYDTYKLDFSSISSRDKSDSVDIDLDVDSDLDISDNETDLRVDNDLEIDSDYIRKGKTDLEKKESDAEVEVIDSSENDKTNREISNQKNVIKSFWNISPLRFVKMKEKIWSDSESEVKQDVSWYSKSDLMGIISTYIENNLTDDTEILVTIEYSETWEADKIILKTQPRYKSADGVLSIPRLSLEKMIDWIYKSKYETVVIDDDMYEDEIDSDDISDEVVETEKEDIKKVEKKEDVKREEKKEENKSDSISEKDSSSNNDLIVEVEWKKESSTTVTATQNATQTTTQKSTQTESKASTQKSTTQKTTTQKTTQTKKTSNWLSQKDLRDAEEVLWALF